jgi:hypothetical protein
VKERLAELLGWLIIVAFFLAAMAICGFIFDRLLATHGVALLGCL